MNIGLIYCALNHSFATNVRNYFEIDVALTANLSFYRYAIIVLISVRFTTCVSTVYVSFR